MKRTLAAGIVLAALSSATALASADASTSDPDNQHAKAGTYRVTATVNKTEPLLNKLVKIKGAVSPAAPGAAVTLQVKYEGRNEWKTIDTARLNSASKYKFKDKVGSVRERKYRVVKAASANRNAGRSPSVNVTVFGWRTLASVKPLPNYSFFEGTATMNGKVYPKSLRGTLASGPIDYNLNRDCKQLDAVYGIDDSSQTGASASLAVFADGVQKHSGTYSLTQVQRVVTDLSGVFRLTINSTVSGGAVPTVGTPRVLCSF